MGLRTAHLFGGLAMACGLLITAACSREEPRDEVASGAALYASMCKGCHGSRGEGASGPSLRDSKRPLGELASIIDARMPLGDPDRCNGDCPRDIARYILETFKGLLVCDAPTPEARGLRLLTRREYQNTVADLLGAGEAAATPCGQITFRFDPRGATYRSVHVSGGFNGWPGTVAAGGWPLSLSQGVWSATRQVPVGTHPYKFVLDDSRWIADAANPNAVPDGFGGQNSMITVSCAPGGGARGVPDVTASFPVDVRPEGFLFDDHGPSRVVTSVAAGEYLRAARAIADVVDLARVAPCAPGCADTLVRTFATRAFRRPPSDAEVARYAKLAANADATKGARDAIAAILSSPSFLYRSEVGERQPDGSYRLTAWETAGALSYALCGTMPDAELFDAAQKGALQTPAQIEAQARRLLRSPRAREQVAAFAAQWLGVDALRQIDKSPAIYPDFDAELRDAMLEETQRFVTHVFFDGTRKSDELFTAGYTFLNERLAKHYGVGGVSGTELRKVQYPDGLRAGVLGHGGALATTGHSDQSSPIRRGLFVRRRLLCQDLPPPPPNAGGVPKVDPGATTRERFTQHTANPFCKSCHQYIDDLGFGFERFDTVGRLRDTEAGKPIDARGDMNDVESLGRGTHAPFASLAELGKTLAASEAAKTCVAKQAWRFVRGRVEDDTCAPLAVKARFLERGGDLQELVIAIVTSPDFVVRR